MNTIARSEALLLLKQYNKDPFHLQHAFTVEAVMRWYAQQLGYGADADYWGIVGLLHDIDFELYPAEHCLKAPELLRAGGVGEDVIHAVVSHGYGITIECGVTLGVAPQHKKKHAVSAFYSANIACFCNFNTTYCVLFGLLCCRFFGLSLVCRLNPQRDTKRY